MELLKASEQWRTRPQDQRFESISDLLAATKLFRTNAREAELPLSSCRFDANGGRELELTGPTGGKANLTHWAAGQLCRKLGAPAEYIRSLPTRLAADCLNTGLDRLQASFESDAPSSKFLFQKSGDAKPLLTAYTSERYSRVWNCEIAQALVELQSRVPSWQFPEPFRKAGTDQGARGMVAEKPVPMAFASDHDMFVFMVDYERPIEVQGAILARGFFVENSEVGAASVKLTTFLFDFVCCNLIVWGAQNVREISIRHTGTVREKVLDTHGEVLPALTEYANQSARETESAIAYAQTTLLGNTRTEVIGTLFGKKSLGLSRKVLDAAYEVVEQTPRYGDPRSVWGIVNGITEVSQRDGFTDQRVKLDRAAGEVMKMAF